MATTTEEKLDAVLTELHDLKRLFHRMLLPAEVVPTAEAARRLGCSRRHLVSLTARGVFTDGRPPSGRRPRVPRLYYADELDVYRAEDEAGVRRLRFGLGRQD